MIALDQLNPSNGSNEHGHQEIVDAEINSIMTQRDKLKDDLDQIQQKGDRLNSLHAKRDQILG